MSYPAPNFKAFAKELFSILHELNDKTYTYFVCGDFNINLMHYSKVKCVTDYVDMFHSLYCKLLIDKPTRITKHSTTLIDHIYTNDVKSNIVSGIIIDDLSDHLPIFAISKKISAETILPFVEHDWLKWPCHIASTIIQSYIFALVCKPTALNVRPWTLNPKTKTSNLKP